jgi:L-aspartate oxidase
MTKKAIETDFLVLGSGIAGLSFALKAAQLGKVLIVCKSTQSEGSTSWAQGGIAAVFSEEDSFKSHIDDTIEAGAGLCNEEIVNITITEGPKRVQELIDLGVPFSKNNSNKNANELFDLTKEGGHHARRILHSKDATGKVIQETLLNAIRKEKNITLLENHCAIDLITTKNLQKREQTKSQTLNRCLGAYVLNEKNEVLTLIAKSTLLCTGGAGKVYLYTTNPDISTGDGIAMAFRAGARVSNLEFMQFHPTCLYNPQAKSFLISEALRGEGGELIDDKGHAFMKKYHSMGSLAPRDIVARAIDSEMKRKGLNSVFLDMTKLDAQFVKNRFPTIYSKCLEFGIDITQVPIPVVPAAHYMCGGVYVDEFGQTTIKNLFAVGETACTGLHGANRLASNSLLEAVVFAHRAFEKINSNFNNLLNNISTHDNFSVPEWNSGLAVPMEEQINIKHTWKELRTLMWNYVGIVRSEKRLFRALERIQVLKHEIKEYYWTYLLTRDLVELRNLIQVAELIVVAALSRKESRGLHYTLDHPEKNDQLFLKDTIL